MRYPDEKIEEIRNSVNILEVVGSVVRLKKAGKNYVGLCPFHEEKAPSFTVNVEKQIYKCFGCGEGGNVFSFIMKDQNISFGEAVQQLAEKAGISLPKYREDAAEKQKVEQFYVINEFASNWYRNNLWQTKSGQKALDYLLSRGFKEETIKTFELGYAPDEWEGLVKTAAKASYDQKTILESGLALQKSPNSTPYDRFRNRIIFPIKNEFGRTAGFGARKFDESEDTESPKYINSPETPVYHKGRLLYGLFQNKETIRKQDMVILVEGYTDVMSLNEHGIGFCVATLGTALTPRQAQLINRYTKNVVLLYDADVPGVKAALRGAEVLFGANLDIQVVNLGSGADPDSFIRSNSKEAFIEAVENRQSIVDFYSASLLAGANSGKDLSYNEKSERIRDMIDLVDSVRDPLKRELMIKEIGERMSADVMTIFKEYYRKKRSQYRTSGAKSKNNRKITDKPSYFAEIDRIERDLGSIVINAPELSQALLDSIENEDIRSPHLKKIIALVKRTKNKHYTPADLISAAEEENLRKIIADLSFDPYEFPKQNEEESQERTLRIAEDIIKKFKLRRIERELIYLQEKIKKTEASGKDTAPLVAQYQELLFRKNDVSQSR